MWDNGKSIDQINMKEWIVKMVPITRLKRGHLVLKMGFGLGEIFVGHPIFTVVKNTSPKDHRCD